MIKINNNSISSIYDETKSIAKIYKGTLKIYENWRKLIVSGVPPLTIKSKGEDLIDYKIYGNVGGVGDKSSNLYDFSDYSKITRVPYTPTLERWGYNLGILPAGDYTISFELVDDNEVPSTIYVRQKKADGSISTAISLTTSVVTNNPATITADGNTEYYVLCASGSISTLNQAIERISMFKWIKLELGKSATGYEPFGYKISIKLKDNNSNEITTIIYIDEPLKENESISYVDDNLPIISTFKGTNIIEVDTEIQASNLEVIYIGKK